MIIHCPDCDGNDKHCHRCEGSGYYDNGEREQTAKEWLKEQARQNESYRKGVL